jgi:PHD/YefM family antitoxin component YafN of YafNO toxin-antitoxin module
MKGKMKNITTSRLRENLADAIDAVEKKEKYLLVTRSGEAKAALVNLDYFEDLLALNSPKYLASIREAREQYKRGEVYTHEEVFGEV